LHIYDHAAHCLRFEVIYSGPPLPGLVFLPRLWNEQTVPLVPPRLTTRTDTQP